MALFQQLLHILMLALSIVQAQVAVKGATGGVDLVSGQRPMRQEFSTFQTSGPAFDLYIQAFKQFVDENQTNLLSYYLVAGIHGYPFRSWDGVEGQYQAGYCTHGSVLFPSWHRPYMALYEQILWENAQYIASQYPADQLANYQAAAQTFRIPYWDWAINPAMPDAVNQPMININTPKGITDIVNPLYNYTFHPQPSAADFPPSDTLAAYHSTVRYPNSANQSQPDLANKQLVANGNNLHTMTYQLIADQSSYAPFSNTGYTDNRGQRYNSLENMHNAIHSLVGNGGHMSIIPYSSFDPIFWLHHAQVDRLLAIWQAIYPDSYTTPQVNDFGTYTDAPGSTEDINTSLTPFHSDNGTTLYNSQTARSTRTFGYTYPEVIDWNVTATQLASNVRTNLNNLYNPTGSIPTKRMLHGKRNRNHNSTSYLNATTMDHQYFVNIRVDRAASFFIHFFVGPVPKNHSIWPFASTLAGSHSVLPVARKLSPETPAPLSYGQIPLTHAAMPLIESGMIPSLKPEHITPVLTKELSWRVQGFDDNVVETKDVKGLKVFVVGQEVRKAERKDEFPGYGDLVIFGDVTRGRAGGLEKDDDPCKW